MEYKNYKRQVKLSEVLNKPLTGDMIELHEFINHLISLNKVRVNNNYIVYVKNNDDIMFSFDDKIGKFSDKEIYVFLYQEFKMEYYEIKQFVCEFVNDNFNLDKKYNMYNLISFAFT